MEPKPLMESIAEAAIEYVLAREAYDLSRGGSDYDREAAAWVRLADLVEKHRQSGAASKPGGGG